jgi:hypothetical protein
MAGQTIDLAMSRYSISTDIQSLVYQERIDSSSLTATAATLRQSLINSVQRTRLSRSVYPPHTSHLLQPLNVGCFSPLKAAYGHKVSELARQGVFHVDKLDFL